MAEVHAVLLDVMSIQKYIFSSNRLKANIGASYLVDAIYKDMLRTALEKTVGHAVAIDAWKYDGDIKILKQDDIDVEVGFIGGGSALILFQNDVGKQFIYNWTLLLLEKTPGLKTAVALGNIDFAHFKKDIDNLYGHQLQRNKNNILPEVELPRFGIVADCSLTGGGAEVYYSDAPKEKHISASMYAKMMAADKANSYLQTVFQRELGNKFIFTDQVSQLGQTEGRDYIAVVHIDGNDMGKKFNSCQTLQQYRQLSVRVTGASVAAFKRLLLDVTAEYDSYVKDKKNLSFKIYKDEAGKLILPLRPIILGGDDITFVAHGQLGLIYTERYMRYLLEEQLPAGGQAGQFEPFYSCAGVAIMNTAYPFFKGYKLAEELCAAAKRCYRDNGGAWLDYYKIQGEVSGELQSLIKTEYSAVRGNLHFGPYCLTEHGKDIAMLRELKQGIASFRHWPRNKAKELGSYLIGTTHELEMFLRDQHLHGHKLPPVSASMDYTQKGWYEKRTPYWDMIELMDFMPQKVGEKA